MKLDVNVLRYLSKDDFRVLTAVEMGQKNHEIVPSTLIDTIARLKHGGAHKCLKELLRHKLVHHESKKYDGYRLTNLGYDYLAIRTLTSRGSMCSIGRKIGVGKEADIYEVADDEGNRLCLKLHRLGRTSFRAVKSKRDYLRQGSHYSWLYLSRLSAVKEFAFMKALGARGLPVPEAIDQNRHAVLMSLVDAFPLCQVGKVMHPAAVYTRLIDLMEKLAKMGLVHCDFNEFNILINESEDITLIDFPQMVSTNHWNAEELFERDVDCLIRFFSRKLGYVPSVDPDLKRVRPDFKLAAPSSGDLDADLRASGFKREDQAVLDSVATDESGGEQDTSPEPSDAEDESVSEEDLGSEASEGDSQSDEDGSDAGSDEDGCDAGSDAVARELGELHVLEQQSSAATRRRRPTPDAAAVGEKLRDQQRKAARKAALVSASRNATKGKNRGKKKGSGTDAGGGVVWG